MEEKRHGEVEGGRYINGDNYVNAEGEILGPVEEKDKVTDPVVRSVVPSDIPQIITNTPAFGTNEQPPIVPPVVPIVPPPLGE